VGAQRFRDRIPAVNGRHEACPYKKLRSSLNDEAGNMTHAEIVKGMQELRKRVKPDRMSVRSMVGEGRNRKPGPKPSSPKSKEPMRVEDHPAFGIWADREDMKDPSAWVRKIRASRYDRLGRRRPTP
jgi:hypothetical protein